MHMYLALGELGGGDGGASRHGMALVVYDMDELALLCQAFGAEMCVIQVNDYGRDPSSGMMGHESWSKRGGYFRGR